jgi:beta-lactamase regulating signal transducer with metallopeptidase domain
VSDILHALLEANLAGGAAIAIMLLVRGPAQRVIGPRAVYLLWATVPIAMLATFIPARTVEVLDPSLPERIVIVANIPQEGINWNQVGRAILLALWSLGAMVLATALVRRQALFHRDADRGVAGPAVVGFSFPRIVTPDDFTERFSPEERKLILTHEEIHIDHSDPRINAFVAVLRCLCWFNPLVHFGAAALRVDQELACDAEVVERRPKGRRAYAETLLKTQLAARPLPVGCYWPAEAPHPLKARIAMLARAPLSRSRRLVASFAVMVLAASGGVAAWAAQPERPVFRESLEIYVLFQPLARESFKDDPVMTDTEPAPPP